MGGLSRDLDVGVKGVHGQCSLHRWALEDERVVCALVSKLPTCWQAQPFGSHSLTA